MDLLTKEKEDSMKHISAKTILIMACIIMLAAAGFIVGRLATKLTEREHYVTYADIMALKEQEQNNSSTDASEMEDAAGNDVIGGNTIEENTMENSNIEKNTIEHKGVSETAKEASIKNADDSGSEVTGRILQDNESVNTDDSKTSDTDNDEKSNIEGQVKNSEVYLTTGEDLAVRGLKSIMEVVPDPDTIEINSIEAKSESLVYLDLVYTGLSGGPTRFCCVVGDISRIPTESKQELYHGIYNKDGLSTIVDKIYNVMIHELDNKMVENDCDKDKLLDIAKNDIPYVVIPADQPTGI